MYTRGIPKVELITLIELKCGGTVTRVELEELMEKYGDLVSGEKVVKPNPARDELYLGYTE